MITIYQKHKRINSETLRKLLVTELESSLSIQKIEPNFTDSKKSNVDDVTILEPCDKKLIANLSKKHNIYHRIVSIMKQSTQEYYNMKIILGVKYT